MRLVDVDTGEALPELTVPELNRRMIALADRLDPCQQEIDRLANLKGAADLRYAAVYDATLVASEAKSVDRREAEAREECRKVPGSSKQGEALATECSRLDVQLRIQRECAHNLRSQISATQSAARLEDSAVRMAGYGGAA